MQGGFALPGGSGGEKDQSGVIQRTDLFIERVGSLVFEHRDGGDVEIVYGELDLSLGNLNELLLLHFHRTGERHKDAAGFNECQEKSHRVR